MSTSALIDGIEPCLVGGAGAPRRPSDRRSGRRRRHGTRDATRRAWAARRVACPDRASAACCSASNAATSSAGGGPFGDPWRGRRRLRPRGAGRPRPGRTRSERSAWQATSGVFTGRGGGFPCRPTSSISPTTHQSTSGRGVIARRVQGEHRARGHRAGPNAIVPRASSSERTERDGHPGTGALPLRRRGARLGPGGTWRILGDVPHSVVTAPTARS